ncbi:hypothetical protein B0H16DRAFT_1471486 [Mycena metata]|uniref:Uncharacterized protein n=1 Tax=Mycena metata TaxID=1033252 RepID=A0AAD7HR24_9AGAR|nr:hypothetical protein B0H16DRAFT_1471486 [Mycena metata]
MPDRSNFGPRREFRELWIGRDLEPYYCEDGTVLSPRQEKTKNCEDARIIGPEGIEPPPRTCTLEIRTSHRWQPTRPPPLRVPVAPPSRRCNRRSSPRNAPPPPPGPSSCPSSRTPIRMCSSSAHAKIARGELSSLSMEEQAGLREALVGLAGVQGRTRVVRRKVYSAVVALAIRSVGEAGGEGWEGWVEGTVGALAGAGAPSAHIHEFLAGAAEDVGSASLLSQPRVPGPAVNLFCARVGRLWSGGRGPSPDEAVDNGSWLMSVVGGNLSSFIKRRKEKKKRKGREIVGYLVYTIEYFSWFNSTRELTRNRLAQDIKIHARYTREAGIEPTPGRWTCWIQLPRLRFAQRQHYKPEPGEHGRRGFVGDGGAALVDGWMGVRVDVGKRVVRAGMSARMRTRGLHLRRKVTLQCTSFLTSSLWDFEIEGS